MLLFVVMRKWVLIRADISKGYMRVESALVIDKNLTRRRAREYFEVKTTIGNINVSRELYQSILPDERIEVATIPRTKILIGVLRANGEFVPVY